MAYLDSNMVAGPSTAYGPSPYNGDVPKRGQTEGVIDASASYAEECMKRLEAAGSELYRRLGPILSGDAPDISMEPRRALPGSSRTALRIQSLAGSIEAFTAGIENILRTLEV